MLRQLELFGFKSFADKTIFDFSVGITGVVGPNGSGKSNVVDSIKWILGDQSARSLRGKEMTDVIFNGSTSRTGAQFAEATLVFDNRSRFLPMDADEVSVGRRLWQSGDSEYLINRNAARLKDVRDLFVGTGAGAASYCIIEQGRVDQILQSNAANRRLIFEEAAGISRFKSRRTEALRRLERVEQNLLRLTDIVDEVESQVNNVRSQATRAARYREVSAELELLWVGLAADDFRRESVQRELLLTQVQDSAALLEELRQQQLQAEHQLTAADAALSAVDDELRDAERSRAELRSRIASLETTAHHQLAREAELQTDVQRLLRQQTLMNNRVREAEAEQIHLNNVLLHERDAFQRKKSIVLSGDGQLSVLQQAVTQSRSRIEVSRQQLMTQMRTNSEHASAAGALQSEHAAAEKRTADLWQQLEHHRQRLEEISATLLKTQSALHTAQRELQSAENAADQCLRSREQLVSEQSSSQQSLADLREQRSGLIARRTVLEDLEDKQEGFGLGVREILRRAEEADSEPWNLICGSIADLLDVDMDNAALLEVALSGRAQLLVVRKLQPFVDYLNSGRCRITGRVGLISLEDADSVAVGLSANGAGGLPAADATGRSATDAAEQPRVVLGRIRPNDTDEPADDDFSASWWSRPESADPILQQLDMSLSDPFDTSFPSLTFSGNVQVTWVDSRTDSPIVRSVFSTGNQTPPVLFGQRGVVGRADALARSPRQLPHLASDLLADTWIVETLNDGLRLQKESAGLCRFVTLQGELVENDGTLFAGTVRSESAVLSRKSELRRLRNELHRTEHEIAQRELRLQHLSGSIQSTDEDLTTSRQQVNSSAAAVRAAEQSVRDCLRMQAEKQQQLDQLAEQLDSTGTLVQQLQSRIHDVEREHAVGEHTLQQLQQHISELEAEQNSYQNELESLERDRTSASMELTRTEERLLALQESLERVHDDLEQRRLQQHEAERRLQVAQERQRDLLLSHLNTTAQTSELYVTDDQLLTEVLRRSDARNHLRQRRNEATRTESRIREVCRQQESAHHEYQLQIRGIDHQLTTSKDRIREEFQLEVEDAVQSGRSAVAAWLQRRSNGQLADSEAELHDDSSATLSRMIPSSTDHPLFDAHCQAIIDDAEQYAEMRTEIDRRVERLRRQLKKIGHVSTESLDNLNELESRFNRLHYQLKDLEAARDALREIVRRINVESRRMFIESFECIRGHFRELFRRLFGGGEADLILEDPEDVLECAIDVVARPPGKELRSISLLSGGEKTMTAVGLLLSIFKSRPSPFCILDEVDAALDDANIGRFVNVLRDFQQSTQFIMITHRKPTMAVTDVLYGVTMEESGISRRLSLRFEDVDERGNFHPKPAATASRAA